MARRLQQRGGRLSARTGDRVYRLAVVYLHALRIYGYEASAAGGFLLAPHMMLQDMAPIDVALGGDVGLDAVRDVLTGLEFSFVAEPDRGLLLMPDRTASSDHYPASNQVQQLIGPYQNSPDPQRAAFDP